MKRHEALSIAQIIDQALSRTGNRDQYLRQQASFVWSEIVGPTINQKTIRRWVDRDVMHVQIASAAMKNELMFARELLIEKINRAVGQNVISQIIFH